MICIWERLTDTMIRDCYRRHSPFRGLFYDIRYLRNSIHIAHLGMAVKLHSLYIRIVHSLSCKIRYLFNPAHRAYSYLLAPAVHRNNTLNFDKGSILYVSLYLIKVFLRIQKKLDRHGICKVSNRKCHKLFACSEFFYFHTSYPASYSTFAYLMRYRCKLNGFIIKVLAVYDIRIAGHFDSAEALFIILSRLFVKYFCICS